MLADDVLARIFELCVEGNQDDRAATMPPEPPFDVVKAFVQDVQALPAAQSEEIRSHCVVRDNKRVHDEQTARIVYP
ncbi:hypothetical protein ACEPAF_4156 [Sanghuangporus sanghuang]